MRLFTVEFRCRACLHKFRLSRLWAVLVGAPTTENERDEIRPAA